MVMPLKKKKSTTNPNSKVKVPPTLGDGGAGADVGATISTKKLSLDEITEMAMTSAIRKASAVGASQARRETKKKQPQVIIRPPSSFQNYMVSKGSGPPIGNHSSSSSKPLLLPKERRNPFNKYKWEKLKIKKTKNPAPPQTHGNIGRKRYRRSIRLRLRGRIMIFFGALAVLALEKYLDKIIDLEDFQDVYNNQMGIDPWDVDLPASEIVVPPSPLHNLTNSHPEPCDPPLKRMPNIHNPKYHYAAGRKIPFIIHQTAHSRCLTTNFERASRDWITAISPQYWSYYLHDDDAVEGLLSIKFPEFPYLQPIVDNDCLGSTTSKVYLWRYLVLWMYGGLYIDINLFPIKFNQTTIRPDDDGIFFFTKIASKTATTAAEGQQLSTKFMAISPRHPLMYYAIEQALAAVLESNNVESLDPDEVFGEANIHKALMEFTKKSSTTKDKNVGFVSITRGSSTIYEGYDGRSIRVVGSIDNNDDDPEALLSSLFLGNGKYRDYDKMGQPRRRKRSDFESTTTTEKESCFQRIISNTLHRK